MKSTLHIPLEAPAMLFPLLAELITGSSEFHAGTVVLFRTETEGQVVVPSQKGHHYLTSPNWISCFEKTTWRILPRGTQVTITQE